jgi:hypothetical protein
MEWFFEGYQLFAEGCEATFALLEALVALGMTGIPNWA